MRAVIRWQDIVKHTLLFAPFAGFSADAAPERKPPIRTDTARGKRFMRAAGIGASQIRQRLVSMRSPRAHTILRNGSHPGIVQPPFGVESRARPSY